ncbi:MAG: GNAT family N-acetyltransferase [Oscillospiraceae bacterium]|nr:GNAT family N-acetyltransferase [Bacillota bacterium]MBQ6295013.1 GNAT family N-acetyltransferase [Bacillota bacterium]MBR0160755.1 GNAT family N-acetyltransferase [Oscillospiraceae bacterium]
MEGVFVSEGYQRKGYAAELLSECGKWAKEKGCSEFASDCELDNIDSLRFHLALGFEETNRIICFRKDLSICKEVPMDDHKTRIARREDWKTVPMPEKHETFILNRAFSGEEMDALRCGNIPQAMEDKWFWYMEGPTLWAHRSWTGYCIFRIDFKEDHEHLVTVNRDPEQYASSGIEEDIASLNKLLDWWTETPYDHYHEWLSETYDALEKAGKIE